MDHRNQVVSVPQSECQDKNDDQISRWNRSRHEGLQVGQFYNAPPMFFSQDHHNLWLNDIYRGASAFLICSGPSFAQLDYKKLYEPNMLTMGLNNSVKTFRPNMWVSVDSPDHFVRSIWLDSKIMKFVPICHSAKPIFNSDTWRWMDIKVGDCPNIVYYRRNEHFQAKQFLTEDTINWGDHKDYGGGRSVMLAAIRILYLLGVRRVFLLGCDFNMAEDKPQNYHFEQNRATGSIKGNNSTYKKLINRFEQLRPIFEERGFYVYNCNPDSGLKAFDFVSFDRAVELVNAEWGNIDVKNERTSGMYDEEKPKR